MRFAPSQRPAGIAYCCLQPFPLAFLLARTPLEYVLLVGAVLFVLAVELLNTAIEKLADHVRPERHEDIKYVKDLGSAAVLVSLILAALVWIVVALVQVFSLKRHCGSVA